MISELKPTSRAEFVSFGTIATQRSEEGAYIRDLDRQIWMRTMISKLQPASRAQFVSLGGIATQEGVHMEIWAHRFGCV